jgi:hypothetical protein
MQPTPELPDCPLEELRTILVAFEVRIELHPGGDAYLVNDYGRDAPIAIREGIVLGESLFFAATNLELNVEALRLQLQ